MDLVDVLFSSTFLAEMIFKLIGLGFKLYAKDRFNFFDAFIVMLSVTDVVLFHIVLKDQA